jgi:hypothetical protein
LLGNLKIPKVQKSLTRSLRKEGRKMLKNAVLNKMSFKELILSIDVNNSSGKIAFGIVKRCKSKDYEDGNTILPWEKLKKNFDPVSAPKLAKTKRMFRESKLGKNEDLEIWINNLEDLQVKLEVMSSNITNEQFLVQVTKTSK